MKKAMVGLIILTILLISAHKAASDNNTNEVILYCFEALLAFAMMIIDIIHHNIRNYLNLTISVKTEEKTDEKDSD